MTASNKAGIPDLWDVPRTLTNAYSEMQADRLTEMPTDQWRVEGDISQCEEFKMAEYDGIYIQIGSAPSATNRINAYELTRFLHYFRAAYVYFATTATSGRNERISHYDLSRYEVETAGHLVDEFYKSRHLSVFRKGTLGRLAATELTSDVDDLEISQISYHSPLHIAFTGIPVALVAAVILSGGEINLIGVVKVKLPPIGTGIAKLREAFGVRNRTPRPRAVSGQNKKERPDDV